MTHLKPDVDCLTNIPSWKSQSHTHTHTHTRARAYTHTHTEMRARAHTQTHSRIHTLPTTYRVLMFNRLSPCHPFITVGTPGPRVTVPVHVSVLHAAVTPGDPPHPALSSLSRYIPSLLRFRTRSPSSSPHGGTKHPVSDTSKHHTSREESSSAG